MDIEALLAEIAGDAPCGPDLSYDQAFFALEQAARDKAEQQFGDTVIPGEGPDWNAVQRLAEELFGRTKDLRVAVHYLRALVCLRQLGGLHDGLLVLEQLFERYWASFHPLLDADDNDDPTERVNAMAPLTESTGFLRDLRQAQVVNLAGVGKVTIRDILVMQGRFPQSEGETPLTQNVVEAAMRAAVAQSPDAVSNVRESYQAIGRISRFLNDKLGPDVAPDLRPLFDMVKAPLQLFEAVSPAPVAESEGEAATEGTAGEAGAVPVAAQKAVGELRTRDDAIRTLDKVCEFMERNEPGHPAPLLIRRAQRLMQMSFFEIIGDLAPDSLSKIKGIAGISE